AFWSSHAETGTVAATMSYGPVFVFYIIGIIAAAFHLGTGIWTFLITWGITIGQRSQRISQVVTTALSLAVSAVGIAIALAFVSAAGGLTW
ncbi:MAG TPA: succinate dehydrogenase, partial [Chloroflexia bacterium]|nr:succinate dehydrogenase [Chloroflexia bacterium]